MHRLLEKLRQDLKFNLSLGYTERPLSEKRQTERRGRGKEEGRRKGRDVNFSSPPALRAFQDWLRAAMFELWGTL